MTIYRLYAIALSIPAYLVDGSQHAVLGAGELKHKAARHCSLEQVSCAHACPLQCGQFPVEDVRESVLEACIVAYSSRVRLLHRGPRALEIAAILDSKDESKGSAEQHVGRVFFSERRPISASIFISRSASSSSELLSGASRSLLPSLMRSSLAQSLARRPSAALAPLTQIRNIW